LRRWLAAHAPALASSGTPRRRTLSVSAWASAHGKASGAGSKGKNQTCAGCGRGLRRTDEAWRLALADQGIDDASLARDLGDRFITERRARYEVFDDVVSALSELRESYKLAIVTNGASCLQRDKLAASGLSDYFDALVVSADLGVAKPTSRSSRMRGRKSARRP
jgi:phosphoglycolate phosphatase-like HAD superfamily hydrolase